MTISTLQAIRRYYLKIPKWVRFAGRWAVILGLAIVGDYLIVVLLAVLTSSHLFDWNTFFSFGGVEVLAIALAKLLGIGEPSNAEKTYQRLQLAALTAELALSHARLEVLFPKDEPEPFYPDYPYYVVNTDTKVGYWIPQHIYYLFRNHIIRAVQFDNIRALKRFARKHKIRLVPRFPWEDELKTKGGRNP
ncbi:MAG: hypothetical protein ABSF00_10845 [Candidatus Bathyarchaeia archaeon]|jgi:hypothetical protein